MTSSALTDIDAETDAGRLRLTLRRGAAGRPPFLCLHGLGGGRAWWHDMFLAATDEHATMAAADLLGFGDSARLSDAQSYDSGVQVASLVQALNALGFDRVVAVAHSMASMLVPGLARANVLAGAVLVEGNLLPEDAKWSGQIATNDAGAADELIRRFQATAPIAFRQNLRRARGREELEVIAAPVRAADRRAYFETAVALSRVTLDGTLTAALLELPVPMLYLRGADHQTWSGRTLLESRRIPYVGLDESGHFPMLDQPGRVLEGMTALEPATDTRGQSRP